MKKNVLVIWMILLLSTAPILANGQNNSILTNGEISTPRKSGCCSVDCGDGTSCPDNHSCCGSGMSGACCPSDKPHWCKTINKCYRTWQDAQNACGDDWEVCYVPVK